MNTAPRPAGRAAPDGSTLVLLKYAVRLNGIDDIALMKMDVMDPLKEVNVCVGYRLNGQTIDTPPQLCSEYAKVEPIYQTLPGWTKPVHEARSASDLCPHAKSYLKFIEDFVGAKISILSTGAERDETVLL